MLILQHVKRGYNDNSLLWLNLIFLRVAIFEWNLRALSQPQKIGLYQFVVFKVIDS